MVVYHLVPTSNHNVSYNIEGNRGLFIILFLHQTTTRCTPQPHTAMLFIILFLHQTTTFAGDAMSPSLLFIILFLHQTTTISQSVKRIFKLFIILFLHQTTTVIVEQFDNIGCLSSCSYIKPQRLIQHRGQQRVVYHLVPTSNHNSLHSSTSHGDVVYHLVPTSNHNFGSS